MLDLYQKETEEYMKTLKPIQTPPPARREKVYSALAWLFYLPINLIRRF